MSPEIFIRRIAQAPIAGPIFAIISALALAAAYTAQFGFGLEPCILCLYQRIPYAIIMVLGGVAYFTPLPVSRLIIFGIGLLFAAGAATGFFQVGVEQHWWLGTEACTTTFEGDSIEAIRARIMGTPHARCDQIAWSMFGISMAGYNFLFSLGLAACAFTSLFIRKN
ncbi:MAG: disulfide bond formation protein B [Alphaproteobacteria bacterium]|nr:disulfide bond formation protein B [Alphaproteobacteria bacterium]